MPVADTFRAGRSGRAGFDMSFLSRLFGGTKSDSAKAPAVVEREDYEGHLIEAMPQAEAGQWRLRARLSKSIDGERRTHDLIRADLLPSAEEAARQALAKGRLVIDEMGDRLYG